MDIRLRLLCWLAVACGGIAFLPVAAFGQACTYYASNAGGGSGTTSGSAFRIGNFLALPPSPGQTLCLVNGTYVQDGIMANIGVSGGPSTPITIRALNDGGAFIDGQYARDTLFLNGESYWVFKGFDVGNSLDEVIGAYGGSTHLTFQRICAWNAHFPSQTHSYPGYNIHTVQIQGLTDSLFEDMCIFGYGRNTYNNYQSARNTVRRLWTRWDGWAPDEGATCPGGHVQQSYNPTGGNSIWENLITIFSGGLYDRSWLHPDGFPCFNLPSGSNARDGVLNETEPNHFNGVIDYGYSINMDIVGTNPADYSGWHSRWVPNQYQDFFTDARHILNQDAGPSFYCDHQTEFEGSPTSRCDLGSWNRFTTLKKPGQGGPLVVGGGTNIASCTALGSCPNFYTGAGSGGVQGSQACTQYSNGNLTSTPLWPWPMDERVKQALSRSGIGPTLAGTAGPGYTANTVTSEIVSRYGTPPAQCIGAGAPPPPTTTAWWHFDAGTGTTATDSLSSHVITLPTNVTWTTPGKVGGASLRCNANTTPALSDITVTNATYTWMVWLKSDAAPSNTIFHAPVANGLNDNTDAWGLWWSAQGTPDWTQSIFHRDATGLQQTKIPVPLLANTWYHLAATYDGVNLRTYLNGQPQTTIAAGAPVTPSAVFRVCGRFFPSAWSGNLDDLRLDDHAWTSAEVLAEYQRTVGAGKRIRHRTQPH